MHRSLFEDADDWDEREEPDEPESEDDGCARCPHCGESVWEDSERCSECGSYLSREDDPSNRKPLWFVLVILACLAGVTRCAGLWSWLP